MIIIILGPTDEAHFPFVDLVLPECPSVCGVELSALSNFKRSLQADVKNC